MPFSLSSLFSAVPSEWLRKLEIEMNEAFNQYREMYFEGGVRSVHSERRFSNQNYSSVYLWDLDHGFAGVILIKKTGDTTPTGSWDSIHVFECKEKTRSASYKLTTTVMMWLQTNNKVNLSQSI